MRAFPRFTTRPLAGLALAAVTATLVACGGDDATELSGVAAVGEPIVGGAVSVQCAGGAALNTTTSASGAWQVTINGQTLPCAAQVQGGTVGGAPNGTPLHSIALSFGQLNITPLTDLVVARSIGGSPQAWFAAPAFAGLDEARVQAALTQVSNALGIGTALNGRNPLTTAFQPVSGDPIDDLLQALGSALQTLGTDFAALLAAAGEGDFSAFAALPNTIAQALGSAGGGNGGGSCSSGVAVTYDQATAGGPYSDQQTVCAQASATTLTIDGKTLSNPTQNTVVQLPFAAYTFVDGSFSYEVVLNNGALYEINFLSGTSFLGQFTPAAGSGTGGVTLTLEIAVNGTVVTTTTIPNQTEPASQDEFCTGASNDPALTDLQVQTGITLTITGCSFANHVGTIQATALSGGVSVPYVVRFIYGS